MTTSTQLDSRMTMTHTWSLARSDGFLFFLSVPIPRIIGTYRTVHTWKKNDDDNNISNPATQHNATRLTPGLDVSYRSIKIKSQNRALRTLSFIFSLSSRFLPHCKT